MQNDTLYFIEAELEHIAPLPLINDNYPSGFKMQIRGGDARATKWINLSAAQLKKIEAVLLGK